MPSTSLGDWLCLTLLLGTPWPYGCGSEDPSAASDTHATPDAAVDHATPDAAVDHATRCETKDTSSVTLALEGLWRIEISVAENKQMSSLRADVLVDTGSAGLVLPLVKLPGEYHCKADDPRFSRGYTGGLVYSGCKKRGDVTLHSIAGDGSFVTFPDVEFLVAESATQNASLIVPTRGTLGIHTSVGESGLLSPLVNNLGNPGNGFIIRSGGPASSTAIPKSPAAPTFTLGITPADRALFTHFFPLRERPTQSNGKPNWDMRIPVCARIGDIPLHDCARADVGVDATQGKALVDTGYNGLMYWTEDAMRARLGPYLEDDGVNVKVGTMVDVRIPSSGGQDLSWRFKASKYTRPHAAWVRKGKGLNTGYGLLFQYDLLVDICHGVIGLRERNGGVTQ